MKTQQINYKTLNIVAIHKNCSYTKTQEFGPSSKVWNQAYKRVNAWIEDETNIGESAIIRIFIGGTGEDPMEYTTKDFTEGMVIN